MYAAKIVVSSETTKEMKKKLRFRVERKRSRLSKAMIRAYF